VRTGYGLNEVVDIEWRPIKDYEGLYEVSNYGDIKRLGRTITYPCGRKVVLKDMIRARCQNSSGYTIVDLTKNRKGKSYRVHILVAQAFIPNPDNKSQVNHKDFNKTNNHIDNLEWVHPIENTRHAINSKKHNHGEIHYEAKITNNDAKEIYRLYALEGVSAKLVAKKFNITTNIVYNIKTKRTWKHIHEEN
jgi:hypothetical protein